MLTVEGDKFVIARWLSVANMESLREDGIRDLEDEAVVKITDIAVLRNSKEINVLAEQIKKQIDEFYQEIADEEDLFPTVYTWHTDGMHPDLDCPYRMVLFRGEEEVCSVYFEQVEPIKPD